MSDPTTPSTPAPVGKPDWFNHIVLVIDQLNGLTETDVQELKDKLAFVQNTANQLIAELTFNQRGGMGYAGGTALMPFHQLDIASRMEKMAAQLAEGATLVGVIEGRCQAAEALINHDDVIEMEYVK